jgi:hypothetical protein
MMLAKGNVKEGDVIIAMIDEWRNGEKSAFDGNVLFVNDKGAEVVYLSGYRSRNDFVEWANIVAKVDRRKPVISVADGTFSGNFMEFESPHNAGQDHKPYEKEKV